MGHLLGLIVGQRNRPVTRLMISALVLYIDGNDAGSGFYKLAQDFGELPPGTLSAQVKEKFWIGQPGSRDVGTYIDGNWIRRHCPSRLSVALRRREPSDAEAIFKRLGAWTSSGQIPPVQQALSSMSASLASSSTSGPGTGVTPSWAAAARAVRSDEKH